MKLSIKRLDHLGIVAGTLKDLKIAKLIDERLKKDDQEDVTYGEAVVAMIINGLGFVSKPLTLAEQFFETKPVDILIRDGITNKQLNRHKFGRTLERICDYGCNFTFDEIALSVGNQEKVNITKCHNDTTSFSFSGEYKNQDENAEIFINYGHSKAKRPDQKQIKLELCVSDDGGVPFALKLWSGNSSDNVIFNERIKEFKQIIAESGSNIVHIADSKLYTRQNILQLGQSGYFITRVPATINVVAENVTQAIKQNEWIKVNDENKLQVININHYEVNQRWIVVYSDQANNRAKKTMTRQLEKKELQLKKDLFHLKAECFACEADAQKELKKILKKYYYFAVTDINVSPIESHCKRGRPVIDSVKEIIGYKIEASYSINQHLVDLEIDQRSCYVVGTNITEKMLSAQDIIADYKKQDCVEKGFEFLKSPSFFADAFFLKNPKRIQGMLVIMALSLLVYTVAQRRMRNYMDENDITFPNQINKQIKRPTLRWMFQCLEGIDYVIADIDEGLSIFINGMTDLRCSILSCFGEEVSRIYRII